MGGIYLLVGHDINSNLVNHQVHLANLIFNASNRVSHKDELPKVRVFKKIKPLAENSDREWI